MAGHNKWSKVKHVKGAADARRGRLFSRLAKEIAVATRLGGADPGMNPRLRSAISTARAENMPNDTIERAIKKGAGDGGAEAIEEVVYEGYGPGGAAILVEAATDNKNRTAADIRSLFSKNNGNLGASGSVSYLFERKGEIIITAADAPGEDAVFEAAAEAGADDVRSEDEQVVVLTPPDKLYSVSEALNAAGIPSESQRLIYEAQTLAPVEDPALVGQAIRLCELLEENDDVQNVYANLEIPSESAAAPAA